MYSQKKVVGETLNEKYTKKKILKHLSADPGVLHETSKYPETLVALDLKQYDNDTLFYITDNAYEFEIDMETNSCGLSQLMVMLFEVQRETWLVV